MRRTISPIWMLLLAVPVFASPAYAQRASLAERVEALEKRAAEDSSKLELLNQVETLKEETRTLRGQVEELQQQLAQQKESARNQYLDVDGRLTRIEGGARPAEATPPAATSAPAAKADAGSDAPAKSTGKDRADYDAAFKALKAGDYVSSARGFKAFIERWPRSALVPNAHYWLGESYYATGNHALAIEAFRHVGETYPVDAKAPGAWLKLGMSQQAMKQDADAAVTYQYVIDSYAGSDAAKQAAERLKSLKKAPKR